LLPSSFSALDLSFDFSSVSNYSGTSRTFSVDFFQGTTLIGNAFLYTVPFVDGTTSWTAVALNVYGLLSGYAGQTVELRFSDFIPQSWTGPAGLGLDAVSLEATVPATVPEPTLLTLLGVGFAGIGYRRTRRKQTV
jgi:hypothetical protein